MINLFTGVNVMYVALSERDKKYNYSYMDAGQDEPKTDRKQSAKKKKGDGLTELCISSIRTNQH